MVLVVIFDRQWHKFVLIDDELFLLRDNDAAAAADVDLSSSSYKRNMNPRHFCIHSRRSHQYLCHPQR